MNRVNFMRNRVGTDLPMWIALGLTFWLLCTILLGTSYSILTWGSTWSRAPFAYQSYESAYSYLSQFEGPYLEQYRDGRRLTEEEELRELIGLRNDHMSLAKAMLTAGRILDRIDRELPRLMSLLIAFVCGIVSIGTSFFGASLVGEARNCVGRDMDTVFSPKPLCASQHHCPVVDPEGSL